MALNVRNIRRWIEEINQLSGDAEAAHAEEDRLYLEVLRHIGSGRCVDPARYAHEALKTQEIQFARWCE